MNEEALFQRFWQEYRQQRLEEIRWQVRDSACGLSLGESMLRVRRLLGLRQKDLALALRVSVRTIIRHERGQCKEAWLPIWEGLRNMEAIHAEATYSSLHASPTVILPRRRSDHATSAYPFLHP